MYLARLRDRQYGWRYVIRHSVSDGDQYRSQDLFDLGPDPARHIHYPGGNGFYIDLAVEEGVAAKGLSVSQQDLEPLFLPFLDPAIRRVIDAFDRRAASIRKPDSCRPAGDFHRFDRYRLHFLKLGGVDRRHLGCTPDRFYTGLDKKSRDEIEYDFINAERVLRPHELARYTYEIFDLARCFAESFARCHPERIDQPCMDDQFIDCLCALNRDETFWQDSGPATGLRPHLVRYAVMYFDYAFPRRDPFHDFLQDFMNRHRVHRPPASVQVSLTESARLFGVSVEALKKMDCRSLTRQFRRMALQHHPDKGGEAEHFVRLSAAYRKLLNHKSRF
jgi:hypothetical protein